MFLGGGLENVSAIDFFEQEAKYNPTTFQDPQKGLGDDSMNRHSPEPSVLGSMVHCW